MGYLKYGFIELPENPQRSFCLVCLQSFHNDALKPSKLKKSHTGRRHSGHVGKPMGFFIKKKENYFKERKVLAPSKEESCNLMKDGLQASYNIALSIAKKTKPHTIGEELIMPAVTEVLKNVLHHTKHKQITSAILLSNNTVQRRIYEIVNLRGGTVNFRLETV